MNHLTTSQWLLAGLALAGLVAMVAGSRLRTRAVYAEHWLWRRRRRFRAKMLLSAGATMTLLSAAGLTLSQF